MLGLQRSLAGSKERARAFADEEMGAFWKTELLLAFGNELGATLSVGFRGTCYLCYPLADLGAKNDDSGFSDESFGEVDGGSNLSDVVAVLYPHHVEAHGFKSLGCIFTLGGSSHGIKGDVVAVVDENEIVELEVASESERLHGDTLLNYKV